VQRGDELLMRIRFEHTLYPQIGRRSGYNQFVRYLDPQRYSVELHGSPDSDANDKLPICLNPFRPWLRSWVTRHGGMPWYKLVDFSAEIAALDQCRAGHVEIIHFLEGEHCGQFLPRALERAKLPAIRSVATFHQPPEWESKVVNPDLLRWFDAILLVSPSQLTFFKRFVPEHRLHVILHGVDTDFFRPTATLKKSNGIRCITTGHWLRDWDTFRLVASACPDITFDVVTAAETSFGNLNNVNIQNGISDDTLAELYRSADILFLPLIESTANNTLLEGIASGLPVVTTDFESVRAYLPNDEGILLSAGCPERYIDALQRLQHNIGLREEMGRRARARAEYLAWPQVARRFEIFYEEILRRPPINSEVSASPVSCWRGTDTGEPNILDPPQSIDERLVDTAELITGGNKLLKRGCYEHASVMFEMVLSACPNDYRAHAGLARTAEHQWRWRTAVARWDRCSKLMPNEISIEAVSRKAHCLIQIGAIDEARNLFVSIKDHFEGVAGQARLAIMLGSPESAVEWWEKCTRQFPNQIDGFLEKARNLVDLARYTEADQFLWKVVSTWPNSKRASVLWANSPAAERNWKAAEARWKVVLARHTDNAFVAIEYARYLATSNISQDGDLCRVTLPADPIVRTKFLREYYLAQSKYQQATELVRTLVKLEQEKLLHRLQLARLLMAQESKESMQESISLLQDLRNRSPDSVIVKIDLIEAYIRSSLDREANEILQSIPASEKRVEAEILRAWAQHHDSRDWDAMKCWRTTFLDFEMLRVSKSFFRYEPLESDY
jgi:glycosyltransferase involved in cell wall biosynthesis/Tfp pilus assembly protein PilF